MFGILGLALWIAIPKDLDVVNPYGEQQILEFLQSALHPDLSPEFLGITWAAAGVTLSYAVVGTFASLILGCLGAFLTADVVVMTLAPKFYGCGMHRLGRCLLTIPRSLHEVVWGLLWVNLIGLDSLAGILAIAIPYGAIVAKIYGEILDDTPQEGLQSLVNGGTRPWAALVYGILPKAKLSLMSYGFYRFECSLRSAAILGIIGAGGLGYQMILSLQSLRYEQLWTLFYGICLLNGLVDGLSSLCRSRLGAPRRFDLKRSPKIQIAPLARPSSRPLSLSPFGLSFGLLSVGAIAWAWGQLSPNLNRLWSGHRILQLHQVGTALWPFTLKGEFWRQLPLLSLQTLALAVVAIAIAGTLAFSLAWFAASSIGHPGLQTGLRPMTLSDRARMMVARLGLLLMRAIPSPIWALVILYLMRPGILAGAIALGVHNAGVMGRLFAEEIENVDARPVQALQQSGVGFLPSIFYGLMFKLGTRFSSYAFYRLEVCLRESLILGLVGAGGLGVLLKEEISNFNGQPILIILVCFFGMTLVLERLGQNIRV